MKKICILGLGYIGLPTAAMFATHGHKIIGADKILSSVEGPKVVAILGITYKANVDDMRESPIFELVDLLKSKDCVIRVIDPHIKEHDSLFRDIYKAVQNSTLLLLAVNHFEFRHLDFKKIYELMRNKYIWTPENIIL